jgi:hypothetical protein
MIQRFLFDRVDAETRALAVRVQNHLIVAIDANETEAAIPGIEPTASRAQMAFDASIGSPAPPSPDHSLFGSSLVAKLSFGGRFPAIEPDRLGRIRIVRRLVAHVAILPRVDRLKRSR